MQVDVSICVLLIFQKALDSIPHGKFWERLQQLGIPLHLQQVVKTMYTTIYAKVLINEDAHGELMSNSGVKQTCPFFLTLFSLYIDELETCMDETNTILRVHMWLPFFSILTMLFCSLNYDQA